jgi:hypothetical protein
MQKLININNLGLSRAAADRLKDAVRPVKRGRKWLVRADDLKDYLKQIRPEVRDFAEEILEH